MADPYAWPPEVEAAIRLALEYRSDWIGRELDASVLWGTPKPIPAAFVKPTLGATTPQARPVTTHRLDLCPATTLACDTPERPNLPQEAPMSDSAEQAEPTPEQRRAAWLSLMADLERMTAATMVNARGAASTARALIADGCAFDGMTTVAEWKATEYAARRLLSELGNLKAPEVPRDDSLGQEAIPMPEETPQQKLLGAFGAALDRARDISTGTVLEPDWGDRDRAARWRAGMDD